MENNSNDVVVVNNNNNKTLPNNHTTCSVDISCNYKDRTTCVTLKFGKDIYLYNFSWIGISRKDEINIGKTSWQICKSQLKQWILNKIMDLPTLCSLYPNWLCNNSFLLCILYAVLPLKTDQHNKESPGLVLKWDSKFPLIFFYKNDTSIQIKANISHLAVGNISITKSSGNGSSTQMQHFSCILEFDSWLKCSEVVALMSKNNKPSNIDKLQHKVALDYAVKLCNL